MLIIFKNFKLQLFFLICFSVCIGFVDYEIFRSLGHENIHEEFRSVIFLILLKLVFSGILVYGYCSLGINLELYLKELTFKMDHNDNSLNFFTFVTQNVASNYYIALVRIICELSIVSLFLILVLHSVKISFNPMTLTAIFFIGILFGAYLKIGKSLRLKAATAQNNMIKKCSPLIDLMSQIKNINSTMYALGLIKEFCHDYKKYNSLSLFIAQLPKVIIDVGIVIILLYALRSDFSIASVGILGLRLFTSTNSIINQIPQVLHYRPYLKDLIVLGLEK